MTHRPEAIEHAFLADVVAQPDDPSPWLILADWLDDRDDPRGEVVRLAWQLRNEPEHPDFDQRQSSLQALLAAGTPPVAPRLTAGGIEFAWVPPGTFWMGTPDGDPCPAGESEELARRASEETRHRVTIAAGFWMSVYPVTQGQWRAIMGENPSAFVRNGAQGIKVSRVADADRERFPVDGPSWVDCQWFCSRLSERVAGRVYLPTEAQWEYACRAGTTTTFHFGPSLNGKQANCDGQHPLGTRKKGPNLKRPTVVGSYRPNAFGLYDMHGNVWEWCQDAFRADYENLPATDPLSLEGDGCRVLRGGSWGYHAYCCRSANRDRDSTRHTYFHNGCRVCLLPDRP